MSTWAMREEFIAECDEFDRVMMIKAEWNYIDAKLNALHKRRFEGDDTELTRLRIQRLEALQACLCGDSAALAR